MLLSLNQLLKITSDLIFTNNNIISYWATMQKQAVKNMMKQQLQQIDLDLDTEYCNYNSEITLLPSLDVINYKTWSINRTKNIIGLDSFSNNMIDIILAHLLLNPK